VVRRGWVRHGLPVGVSTVLAFLAGALANVFTAGWSWPVGVALGVLLVGWVGWEIRQATRAVASRSSAEPPSVAAIGPGEAVPRGVVWNVAPRNRAFTGREDLLTLLRQRLGGDGTAAVQVVRGTGGVGKTQLAVEYAYRYADGYPVVWWIAAEEPALIGDQMAALAVALGLAQAGTDTTTAARALKADLRRRGGWLLLFDSAEDPSAVSSWLPGGTGHVIVTTRSPGWEHLAATIEVDVMARADSVDLLRRYHPGVTDLDAGRLADALGDLPLALVQAGSFLTTTGASVDEYLRLLAEDANRVMAEGAVGTYPRTLSAAITISTRRLADTHPTGVAVLHVCAFLAPEPVPADWLGTAVPRASGHRSPASMILVAADAFALRASIARIGAYGLAKVTSDGIWLHRLTQAVLRDGLTLEERNRVRDQAAAVLVANNPGEPDHPATWRRWSRLLPHVLALQPAASDNRELREVAWQAARYLLWRGETNAGHQLAVHLHRSWCQLLGPDDPSTLWAAHQLAIAYEDLGRYEQARDLSADTLARRRTVLGDDHPDTLRSANALGYALHAMGEHRRARHLYEDSLARSRRALGDDHPATLRLARSLTGTLAALAEHEQARQLGEDTLARSRRVLGPDHPVTREAARHLTFVLRALGEYAQARELGENILNRSRRLVGDDHPDTLRSACTLAGTLAALGEYEHARGLAEDTLVRTKRVLGRNHPDTVKLTDDLTRTLRGDR
jgi:tetratricopeptide (TPR) repeat protein